MSRIRLGNALAAIVAAIGVLNAVSASSMPVRARHVAGWLIVLWLVLLLAHAAGYKFGERMRGRFGLGRYVAGQCALLFAIAVSRVPTPVVIALFMAATVELVLIAGESWGTARITIGAIALFVLASLVTSSLYFATTAGLVLAATGLVAHAVAALLRRAPPAVSPVPAEVPAANSATRLSAREVEILRELVSGARNSEIARRLGITERTVKSHLGSIYQKLGVESRGAAVAAAVRDKLV